jgi:tetratricopeptide (TPR) repeat protein
MKIAVYAIAKNESQFVQRFVASAHEADTIVVADTGSTDNTVALLKAAGCVVHHININPWRFDDARNAVLALLPTDIDVCVSLDLDEVLVGGWREEIERVWKSNTTRMFYGYDWGSGVVFQREKFHARKGYRWRNACHELPVVDRIQEVCVHTDTLLVVHKPDESKPRSQYLDLLRVAITEDPQDSSIAFYYGRELYFYGNWQQSINECLRALALPGCTWEHERCYAYRIIGKCYQEMGRWDDALKSYRLACIEAPNTREPWHAIAKCCYELKRWTECLGACLNCLSITQRLLIYTCDPEPWGWSPHDLASIAAYNLGMYELANEHAKKAVELEPADLRLRQNLEFCQQKVAA